MCDDVECRYSDELLIYRQWQGASLALAISRQFWMRDTSSPRLMLFLGHGEIGHSLSVNTRSLSRYVS